MPDTPVAIFRRATDRLLTHDMAGFTALYADDAIMEFPFAPPGWPQRLEGRKAVEAYLDGYTDRLDVQRVHDVVVHETTDPDVIVAEMAISGRMVANGEPYTVRYVAVLTIAGGLIRHYRDYWNPLILTETMMETEVSA
ncbi:nuclear transport factor 2 family protein [Micromonospora fiedleri]|uniref:Nuclear transport factor 2 family protein n=1 Tax=Micromonospora fiedleri TaxID=1157498 RepID=A0ABS1UJP5_9ACTN|nr:MULTISPECIES: nuclear transport factor 2 family protein [Micromonospora]MBL6276558.1 nuclear transport factor 2 family protein [Micromonospora fiedleri]WSK40271.1 nuclear transport factor 2 family protein [Micromonospora maris]